jgi:hypothetical protein
MEADSDETDSSIRHEAKLYTSPLSALGTIVSKFYSLWHGRYEREGQVASYELELFVMVLNLMNLRLGTRTVHYR